MNQPGGRGDNPFDLLVKSEITPSLRRGPQSRRPRGTTLSSVQLAWMRMFFCTSQILWRASSGPQIMRLRRSTPLRGEDDGQFFKTPPGRGEGVRLFS